MWVESLTFPTAVSWSYYTWAFLSQIVAILAFMRIARAIRRKDLSVELFLLYLAIGLAWQGSAANKWWFGIWRLVDFPGWMASHGVVVLYSMLVLFGALIHIRVLTQERWGAWGWVLALAVSVAGTALVLRLSA